MTESSSIALIIEERTLPTRGVAVAVNGTIVPKSLWHSHVIADGDRVEVVTAAAGG